MKLTDVLEIAHQAYPNDEIRLTYKSWAGEIPKYLGDQIAKFILVTAQQVCRPDQDEMSQTFAVLKALKDGRDALDRVVTAFSIRHQAVLQARPQPVAQQPVAARTF